MKTPGSSSFPWKITGYLFLAGAACWYLAKDVVPIQSALGLSSDFGHYYDAGRRILNGSTPYSDPSFLYPSVVAFASAPFALTSYLTARWIWFLSSHVMLLLAGFLIWRRLGGGMPAACCTALVWAGGGAAGESLALGQMGPLVVLLLTLAYTTSGTRRGIAAGVGSALKLLPGVLLLPLALSRDWRAMISLLTSASVLILAPALGLRGLDGPQSPEGSAFLLGTPAILSWSIPSTVLRIMDPPQSRGALPHNWEFGHQVTSLHLTGDQRMASAASSLLVLALGAIVLAWRTEGWLAGEELPVAMAGFLSLALAAAPLCWSHYQIFQYPGVALMLGLAVARRQWTLAGAMATCGALTYPIPVAVLTHYYRLHGWTAASPWQLYVWTSLPPVACLSIFGLSLKLIGKPKPVAQ